MKLSDLKLIYLSFIGIVSLASTAVATAQDAEPWAGTTFSSPVPPTVAALYEVERVAVDMASGRAQVSVPLHTVRSGTAAVPIGISHNGDALRPQQIPGPVGHGWTLAAGGVITRSVRGVRDESSKGLLAPKGTGTIADYLWSGYPLLRPGGLTKTYMNDLSNPLTPLAFYEHRGQTGNFCKDLQLDQWCLDFFNNGLDTEPDVFFATFGGRSFTFYLSPTEAYPPPPG